MRFPYREKNQGTSRLSPGFLFSYVYDQFGNRWQQNATAGTGPQPQYSFNSKNQISGAPNGCTSANAYCYDSAGDLLNDGIGDTFAYDAEGRLTTIGGAESQSLVYDPSWKVVRDTFDGTSTDYLNGLNGKRITALSSSGSWQSSELYAAATQVATYRNSTTYWVHDSQVGSVVALSGVNEARVEHTAWLPFGEFTYTSDDGSNQDDLTWFAGMDGDQYNTWATPARSYSWTQGRWLTPDPSGIKAVDPANPQTWNRYVYVVDNPETSMDPTGLNAQPGCWWCGGGGVSMLNAIETVTEANWANLVSLTESQADNQTTTANAQGGQTQKSCGFWCGLGQRIKNGLTGHGLKTDDQLPHESVTHTIVTGWENPYVTVGTDAAGLLAPFAGNTGKVLGYPISAVSLLNDRNPTNVVLNVVPLIVDDSALPLAVVGAEGDLLGNTAVTVENQMIDTIPGSTVDGGNGQSMPNPAVMTDCDFAGGCH